MELVDLAVNRSLPWPGATR